MRLSVRMLSNILTTMMVSIDLIILDPPAFAKHRSALKNGLRGYTRLNVKGFEKIKPGGILFTFSCSQVVTKDNLDRLSSRLPHKLVVRCASSISFISLLITQLIFIIQKANI